MLNKIINSKARLAILTLLFSNESKDFYAQEIVNQTRLDQASVHRELANLIKAKFIRVIKDGKKKYYQINSKNDYYSGLKILFLKYQEKDHKDKWLVLEEMPEYYPMFVSAGYNPKRSNDYFKYSGLKSRFSKLLVIYNDGMCSLMIIQNEFNNLAKEILEKLKNDPSWGYDYIKELTEESEKYTKNLKEISKINLKNISNEELYALHSRHWKLYEKLHRHHWIQSAVDFNDNLFSKYLMSYLKEKAKKKSLSLGEVFSVMTTPVDDGSTTKEYTDLLGLLEYIQKNDELAKYLKETDVKTVAKNLRDVNNVFFNKLENHIDQYGWIGYGVAGPGWGAEYFLDVLSSLLRQESNPKKLLEVSVDRKNELIARQKELIEELDIDKLHERLFEIARGLVMTKGLRKDAMFYGFSVVENLYREMGKRYYLSLKQIRFLYPAEIKPFLLEGKFDSQKLNDRPKMSLCLSLGDYDKDLCLENNAAKEFIETLNIIQEDLKDLKILVGDCASPGSAKGRVKIINVVGDMQKMERGDILVSVATNPDLIPAIKKAAAIVTDLGGITCHAAIVSRELGTPCVTGTRIATKVLKDGDMVDVYANHGKVTIIEKK